MSGITGNNRLGQMPSVLNEAFEVETAGQLPDGCKITCLGVIIDDSQTNEEGAFALGFQFDIPAGQTLGSPLGSDGQSFDLTYVDAPDQQEPQCVFWAIYYMPDDAKSMAWELDFQVATTKGRSVYTFTKKRFR